MKYLLTFKWYQSLLLGMLSGLLLTFAHPPFNFFSLAWVALIPFLMVVMSQNVRGVIWATVGFVVFFYSFYLSWVTFFSPVALPALVAAVLILFYLPTAILSRHLSQKYFFLTPLLIAIAFTCMEYLRTIGFLRFPYGILAYSQWNFTTFIQVADTVGYLGVSFVLYLSNALLAEFFLAYVFSHNRKNFIQNKWSYVLNRFSLLVFLWVALLSYGFFKTNLQKTPVTKTIHISLVQHWFDNNLPWNLENKGLVFDKLAQQSLRAKLTDPDLIVWPETAVLDYYELYTAQGLSYASSFQQFFRAFGQQSTNSWFLTGTLGVDDKYVHFKNNASSNKSAKGSKTAMAGDPSEVRYYNHAILINPQAQVVDRYGKQLLVAFAEWFPYAKIFPWVDQLLQSLQASQFSPGENLTLFKHPKFNFSTLICYEDCFSEICRQMVLGGADALFVLTNDAWSYSVKSEMIHFIHSIFRAVENRRPVLRSSNAGITAYIDTHGQVIEQLEPFREDELNVKVELVAGQTFYTRHGTQYVFGLFFLLVFFFGLSFYLHKIQFEQFPRWLSWLKNI